MHNTLSADPVAVQEWRRLRGTVVDAEPAAQAKQLRQVAYELRVSIVEMIHRAGLGHTGGDLSVTDILATLFGAVLSVDPERPLWPERDRLILSKGHCSAALYATLARCGFFPKSELDTFMAPLSPLSGHPDRTKVPGVEANTGPLGHGLSIAVGCALAARMRGSRWRTFVVLGDGELQEGSNWEAAMTAGHQRLAGLTAVVDRNRLQQGAPTEETNRLEPLADKWRSFGWDVRETDGHDHLGLLAALAPSASERPVCVLAHTVKGKGVSFMENRVEWHHKVPDAHQLTAAIEELSR